jgi:alkylation response protein AidB-like acyl-CoA dehydrogenase
MDFELGEEDLLLRDTVRQLCDQRVRPHAGAFDEARALPRALLTELGSMGLLAMERPEDEGGAGLSAVAASALIGELAAADGALALLVGVHNWQGLAHVAASLGEPERAVELPALVSGERLVAWALPEGARGLVMAQAEAGGAEPGLEGSVGAGALSVVARREGEAWVLDGEVRHVLGAAVAERVVVFGQTDAGPTAWFVDADAEGVSVSDPVRTLGARAAGTAHVRLAGARVPDSRRLGEPGRAFEQAQARLHRTHLGMAAVACGLATGVLQVAAAYAMERRQFGQPIASFQAIQWKLADMSVALDAAWLLTSRAAWLHDAGRPYGEAAARARILATTTAVRSTSEALQIHGGYGYTREYPVERALRDARTCDATEGGNAVARIVLARALVDRLAG